MDHGFDEQCELFAGTVPIANGVFRKIVIRKNRIAQVDVRDLSILRWTDRWYYEVCANPAVYAALQGEKSHRLRVRIIMQNGRPSPVPAVQKLRRTRNGISTTASSATGFPALSAGRISSRPELSPRRNPGGRPGC